MKEGFRATVSPGLDDARRLIRLIPKNIAYQARRLTDFDRRHGTDTTEKVSAAEYDVHSDYSEFEYAATPVRHFAWALGMVPPRREGMVFIDIGAGKGRTLLLASEYPFTRIVGVEFSPRLSAIARDNIRTFHSGRQRCTSLEVVCCDATVYEWPEEPLLVYLANPFGPELMRRVMDGLRQSLEKAPRPVFIIYMNPVQRQVLAELPWLKLLEFREFRSLIRRRPLCRVAAYQAMY